MKVLLLGGGTSPEREVSLQSAAAVKDALTDSGYDVVFVDPADGSDKVLEAAKDVALIMPILHGPGGEDGELQALLERTGKPYLGADVEASQLCINKVVMKEMLLKNGLPTAKFAVVTREMVNKSPLAKQPFVLKPIDDGSSVGLLLVRQLPFDPKKVDNAFAQHHEMLMEELVEGTEITVPILGEETLPIIEIVPPPGEAFDYENKYNGASQELCPPEHVAKEVQEHAQALALQIYRLAGVRHLARVDMIIRPDGSLVVLEINTLPGMTSTSLYPKAAACAGMSFPELVDRLAKLALGKV